jgi:nitroreductase
VNEWLTRVSAAIGCDEELSDEEIDALLKIARYAAHEGGERTNAPLLTYLIGRARGERSLTEILEAIRSS